ncbi:MAG TPA: YebC/PmpR family DNA-binding transcriptional regulator [Thermoclostridium caenicola]|uniref:YebC/PmpR family DNA-binding transcriptional regulator n=1 Tax=Thermoclostridium caenicola TaxID=659425 RepID=UPI002CF24F2C|nr:YebC/PmpR family DNA-binding transcriptional regulator [Thermoclostridium caenicola]HOK43685.1 YebC/PmpR family DNA-binding transcriptional regulator [Thermoclostridium caenicola]HOL84845.1 YebC/PmpR family DNA-binding transcriptional regulator [Thermoclostridium caenicola]HPO76471.1 YebC/PmpR family DNA-binding transcriptional regulator [Thermoclostridium caenicola]
MAGHSKWANIKHKKSKTDAQKGKLFTKIGREIAIAVRNGGPDPVSNSRLRDVIAKAKSCNMPNESIQRSIKKAAGEGDTTNYEAITYEGYGPSGVAVIVEALTDNRNRTAGDIRHLFDKFGGNMGATGCVSFMFEQKGQIIIERGDKDEDEVMMIALDAGASDFQADEEYFEILTEPNDFTAVREKLEAAGFRFESAELTMIPQTYTRLTNPEDIEKMEKLLERLEDHDDVQNIWHNWEQE